MADEKKERQVIKLKSEYAYVVFQLPHQNKLAEISCFLGNHFDDVIYYVRNLDDYNNLEKRCERNKSYYEEQFEIFKINDERLPEWMREDFPDLIAEIPDEYAAYKDVTNWYTIGMKYTDGYSFQPQHEWIRIHADKIYHNAKNANIEYDDVLLID
jgi:hypothetical protein